jgi:hypothetical protein
LIRELKNNDLEEMHITFLRKYTEGAFKCLSIKRAEVERENIRTGKKPASMNLDASEFLSLQKFWEIGQETNRINPKTRELALNCLIELLQNNVQNDKPFLN